MGPCLLVWNLVFLHEGWPRTDIRVCNVANPGKLNNGDHATSLPLQQDMRRHRPSRVYEGRCQSRRLNIGSALDLRRINLAFRSRTDSAL